MEPLRLSLVLIGAIVVVCVLGWDLRRRRADAPARGPGGGRLAAWAKRVAAAGGFGRAAGERRWRGGPVPGGAPSARLPAEARLVELGDLAALAQGTHGPVPGRARPCEAASPLAPVPPDERLLIVLTVAAPTGRVFNGPRLAEVLTSFDLQHGAMGVYHHFGGERRGKGGSGLADPSDRRSPRCAVFSVANAFEPGSFDPERMDSLVTPELSVFLQLPGPLDGLLALDLMVDIGRKIARALDAELRDARRSSLTAQGVQLLREQVIEHGARRGRRRPPAEQRVLH